MPRTTMISHRNRLTPCPFCGGTPVCGYNHGFYVKCKLCGARTDIFISQIESLHAWAKRFDGGQK